jgi:16S rRNA (uracil1498-N3)-methyltransferase
MQVFLGLAFNEDGGIVLSSEESRHCIKVLRHKAGDVINIIDGSGNLFEAEIIIADPNGCVAETKSKRSIGINKPYRLHIAISPTKNPDRIEWMVEKCTELGVDEFSFVICKRTEKKGVKMERLVKIVESAVKQSVQGVIPKINAPVEFVDFIAQQKNAEGKKYLAHCMDEQKTLLKEILPAKGNVLMMIGPEGDFIEEEIQHALLNGFKGLSLGEARLRTETAGLFVAAGLWAGV